MENMIGREGAQPRLFEPEEGLTAEAFAAEAAERCIAVRKRAAQPDAAESGLSPSRLRRKIEQREKRRRKKAEAKRKAIDQATGQTALRLEMPWAREYASQGTNSFDWAGHELATHTALLEVSLVDLLDPGTVPGSASWHELWTWIYGIDTDAQMPFSFQTCCRATGVNAERMQELLRPFLRGGQAMSVVQLRTHRPKPISQAEIRQILDRARL